MLPPVYRDLKNSTRVVEIVADRIFRRGVVALPQSGPYLTWFLVTGVPENTLSETPAVDRMTVQIDVWAPTDKQCEVLATAVRDALEDKAHMTGMPIDGRDPDTKLWRLALEFDYFVGRPALEPTS